MNEIVEVVYQWHRGAGFKAISRSFHEAWLSIDELISFGYYNPQEISLFLCHYPDGK